MIKKEIEKLITPDSWLDLYHLPFSEHGFKRRSVQGYIDAYDFLELTCSQRMELEYQIFIVLDMWTWKEDSLYIHTPNPNKTEFPEPHPVGKLSCGEFQLRKTMDSFRSHGFKCHKLAGYGSVVAYKDGENA